MCVQVYLWDDPTKRKQCGGSAGRRKGKVIARRQEAQRAEKGPGGECLRGKVRGLLQTNGRRGVISWEDMKISRIWPKSGTSSPAMLPTPDSRGRAEWRWNGDVDDERGVVLAVLGGGGGRWGRR